MLKKLLNEFKDFLKKMIKSRLFIIGVVIVGMFTIVINRLFILQIVNGEDYLNNFKLKIEKERTIQGTRGNIFDVNGQLLAYNELSYNVTIEDNGTYKSTSEKNKYLNSMLNDLIEMIEGNGDSITDDFGIYINKDGDYEFKSTGTSQLRFLADIYGHAKITDLKYNKKLGYNEEEATPSNVIDYLCSESMFNISSEDYDEELLLKIVSLRYAISQNSFQKYITTTIASNVSDKTVSCIMENINDFQGVNIEESTVRKYVDSEYFASIIGYTGKISEEEYNDLSSQDDGYSYNDIVGKAGIEQTMELELQGKKGHETVYVDNLGKVIETKDYVESESGNDVYLTIDKDLQIAAYNIVEQKLAGILYQKIINQIDYEPASGTRASDVLIPVSDVYFALINNNIINASHFNSDDASATEQGVYSVFSNRFDSVTDYLDNLLSNDSSTKYDELSKTNQKYIDYIIKSLYSDKILLSDKIDTSDEAYKKWADGDESVREYLLYAISKNWIDSSSFEGESKYSDSVEIYNQLKDYILNKLIVKTSFSKLVYETLIDEEAIGGTQICLILYDQGVLQEDEETYNALKNGAVSAYNFIKDKIKKLEITPGQLALDPCSASCVITDVNSGAVRALVSYPGYDNNKLANTVDAEYYANLSSDLSYPLFNHATQEKTAPGSTFKMVSATAGLCEGVISVGETIDCEGTYTTISPSPTCWIYPSSHGPLSVVDAIRDSCNFFFYEVGYRLSSRNGVYNDKQGIEYISKYAELFGLGSKTGIEIVESEPNISTEYPVTSAIGQGNHNYTTIQLARYVSTVANSGTLYNLTLLDKITDKDKNVIKQYSPQVSDTLDEVSDTVWSVLHSGMRKVVEKLDAFSDFEVEVAGKTGTAEEVKTRGNHALFVGYAPYNNPEIAIATRIAYGYTSTHTAEIASNVLKYYFKEEGYENIVNGVASESSGQVIGD